MNDSLISEMTRRGILSAEALIKQLNEDGSLIGGDDDLGNYYKCVYPVRLYGRTVLASRLINKIMELFYCPNGDLHNKNKSKTGGDYTSNYCQMYPNYWIILGSITAGRWDVASKLIRSATDLYYSETAGSLCNSIDSEKKLYDSNSAAIALDIYSLLGDYSKVERAYEFLKHLEKNQPDPENFFYSRMDENVTICTEPTAKPIYTMINKHLPTQAYWFIGMPVLALVRLYDKTGDRKFLDLARTYFEHFISCGEHRLKALGSGKSMSAAAILYRQTGDIKYYNDCRDIAEFFFSLQTAEGIFIPPGQSPESMTAKTFYDIVPEYTRWLFETASDLTGIR